VETSRFPGRRCLRSDGAVPVDFSRMLGTSPSRGRTRVEPTKKIKVKTMLLYNNETLTKQLDIRINLPINLILRSFTGDLWRGPTGFMEVIKVK